MTGIGRTIRQLGVDSTHWLAAVGTPAQIGPQRKYSQLNSSLVSGQSVTAEARAANGTPVTLIAKILGKVGQCR
jgi:hypothetical protein